MKVDGHDLREHIHLLAPLFGLVAGVWALRMVLSIAGAPLSMIRICSVTVAGAISILLAALLIYFKHFGGYASVATAALLLGIWEQFLIVGAIAFTVFTRVETIYSAPEFGGRLSPLGHIMGHLTFGLAVEALFGAGMGCLLLWTLRKLIPPESPGRDERL
jgi:hypothetical protein